MPSNVIGLLVLCTLIISAHPDNYNPQPQSGEQPATQSPQQSPAPSPSPHSAAATARLCRPNAASIAQEAALEAKAASDAQLVAGQQAAHQVKAQLAERAQQAAQAAQAALVGKQQMVEQLEEEVREAQAVVQEEGASLAQAQQEVQAAAASAQQAQQQLKVLTSAVQLEQANVGNAEQAASGAQQELAEKTQLVEAARRRVQMLLSQLTSARADFAGTRQAADRAMAAAQEAKINAARSRREQPEERAAAEAQAPQSDAHPEVRREALDVQISAREHQSTTATPPDMEREDATACSDVEESSEGHALERRESEFVQDVFLSTRSGTIETNAPEDSLNKSGTRNHDMEVKTGTAGTTQNEISPRSVREVDATSISVLEGYSTNAMTTVEKDSESFATTAGVIGSKIPIEEASVGGSGYEKIVASTEYATKDVTNGFSSYKTTNNVGEARKRRDLPPIHIDNLHPAFSMVSENVPTDIRQNREIFKTAGNEQEYKNDDNALEKEPAENSDSPCGANENSYIRKEYSDEGVTERALVRHKQEETFRLANQIGDDQYELETNINSNGNNPEGKKERREAPDLQNEDKSESIEQPKDETQVEEKHERTIRLANDMREDQDESSNNLNSNRNNPEGKKERREAPAVQNEDESESIEQPKEQGKKERREAPVVQNEDESESIEQPKEEGKKERREAPAVQNEDESESIEQPKEQGKKERREAPVVQNEDESESIEQPKEEGKKERREAPAVQNEDESESIEQPKEEGKKERREAPAVQNENESESIQQPKDETQVEEKNEQTIRLANEMGDDQDESSNNLNSNRNKQEGKKERREAPVVQNEDESESIEQPKEEGKKERREAPAVQSEDKSEKIEQPKEEGKKERREAPAVQSEDKSEKIEQPKGETQVEEKHERTIRLANEVEEDQDESTNSNGNNPEGKKERREAPVVQNEDESESIEQPKEESKKERREAPAVQNEDESESIEQPKEEGKKERREAPVVQNEDESESIEQPKDKTQVEEKHERTIRLANEMEEDQDESSNNLNSNGNKQEGKKERREAPVVQNEDEIESIEQPKEEGKKERREAPAVQNEDESESIEQPKDEGKKKRREAPVVQNEDESESIEQPKEEGKKERREAPAVQNEDESESIEQPKEEGKKERREAPVVQNEDESESIEQPKDETQVEEKHERTIRLANEMEEDQDESSNNLNSNGNKQEGKKERREAPVVQNEDESESIEQPKDEGKKERREAPAVQNEDESESIEQPKEEGKKKRREAPVVQNEDESESIEQPKDETQVEEKHERTIRLANEMEEDQDESSNNLNSNGNKQEGKKERREAPVVQNEDESESIEQPKEEGKEERREAPALQKDDKSKSVQQANEETPDTVHEKINDERFNREVSESQTSLPFQVCNPESPKSTFNLERSRRGADVAERQKVIEDVTQEYLTKENPTKRTAQENNIPPATQLTQKDPEFMSVINSDANINEETAKVEGHQNIVPVGTNEAEAANVEESNMGDASYKTDSQERVKRNVSELPIDSASNSEVKENSMKTTLRQKRFSINCVDLDDRVEAKKDHLNGESYLVKQHSLPYLQLKRSISDNYETHEFHESENQNGHTSQYKLSNREDTTSKQMNVEEQHQSEIERLDSELPIKDINSAQEKKSKRHLRDISHLRTYERADISNTEGGIKGERSQRDTTGITESERRPVNVESVEKMEVGGARPNNVDILERTEIFSREMATESTNVELKNKRECTYLRNSKKKKRYSIVEKQIRKRGVKELRHVNFINKEQDTKQLREEHTNKRDTKDIQSESSGSYSDVLQQKEERKKRETTLCKNTTQVEKTKERRSRKYREIIQLKTEQAVVGGAAKPTPNIEKRQKRDIVDDHDEHSITDDVTDRSSDSLGKFVGLQTQKRHEDHTEETHVKENLEDGSEELQIQYETEKLIPTYVRYPDDGEFRSGDSSYCESPKLSDGTVLESNRKQKDAYGQTLNNPTEKGNVVSTAYGLTKDEVHQSDPLPKNDVSDKILADVNAIGYNTLGSTAAYKNMVLTRIISRRSVSNIPFQSITTNSMGLGIKNKHIHVPENTRQRREATEPDIIHKKMHMNNHLYENNPTSIKPSSIPTHPRARVRGAEERPRRDTRRRWNRFTSAVRMPEGLRKSLPADHEADGSAVGVAATARGPITWAQAG